MSPRPFIVERRALPLRAPLEDKFERALEVVREEREIASVKADLAIMLATKSPAYMRMLRESLNDLHGTPKPRRSRRGGKKVRTAREAAEAAFGAKASS